MIKYNDEDLKNHDGVAGVIRNAKGEVLMLDHVKFNFWTIPVGKVKEHETIFEGLKTEMFEELGIKIKEKDCDRVVVHSKIYHRNDMNIKIVCHIFEINDYSGIVQNMEVDKHRSLKWMSIAEIKKLKNISHATKEYLIYAGK